MNPAQQIRNLVNLLEQDDDTLLPLGFPSKKKVSHIVKPPAEQAKDEAINHLQAVIDYLDSVEGEVGNNLKSELLKRIKDIEERLL